MNIIPIRTEGDYLTALAEVERLMDAKPGTVDGDMLDILTTLVEHYEDRRYPISKSDPIEIIRYAMDERGATQKDLAALFGSKSRASEVLNRKRPLTIEMIRTLNREWHIPVETLIEPYDLSGAKDDNYAPVAQSA